MNAPAFFGVDGRAVRLGERIGRGGEGEVFALDGDEARAAKIYIGEEPERRDKVAAMVRARLADRSPLVAFPAALVNRAGGRFAGFTMRRVAGHQPLFELYAPGARKRAFPRADYRFLIRVAANVARAVGAVHESGCVIGDINHSGLLVSQNATVALIDADSFQFEADGRLFPCRVGVPEYTPPELQGVKLGQVQRTPEHDRFGLAVVIFQLLFMGRHPFSGAYQAGEMPIERAIAEHRFAYTTRRRVGMTPPPAAPTLADFPADVGAAFEAAFAPGDPAQRPTARRWIEILGDLERSLKGCANSPLHFYPAAARACPWCRMEAAQGIALFVAAGETVGDPVLPRDPGAATFDIATVWQGIERVAPPPEPPKDPPLGPASPRRSTMGRAALRARLRRDGLGLLVLVLAVAVGLGVTTVWPIWEGLGLAALALLAGDDPRTRALRRARRDVEKRWTAALDDWRFNAGREPFDLLRTKLVQAEKRYRELPKVEEERIAEYRRNRRSEQLRQYLEGFPIARANLAGIGPSRVATLASYGIDSAADVNEFALLEVPGFGRKTTYTLMVWRRRLEQRFRYKKQPTPADHRRLTAIRAETLRTGAELRRQLLAGAQALRAAARDAERRQTSVDPALQAVHARRMQIQADLRLF